ncbi:MAG: hypothetical protein IKR25_00115 [Muribaculaceae bacterium]|nr:hypothetical protein [Muribaculaceae bacterium]
MIPSFLTILFLESGISRIVMRLYRSRAVHQQAIHDSAISRIVMRLYRTRAVHLQALHDSAISRIVILR